MNPKLTCRLSSKWPTRTRKPNCTTGRLCASWRTELARLRFTAGQRAASETGFPSLQHRNVQSALCVCESRRKRWTERGEGWRQEGGGLRAVLQAEEKRGGKKWDDGGGVPLKTTGNWAKAPDADGEHQGPRHVPLNCSQGSYLLGRCC